MKNILSLIIFLISTITCVTQEITYSSDKHFAFTENKGQWNSDILFKAKNDAGNLWVQQHKFVFHIQDLSTIKENHSNPKANKETTFKQDVIHLNFIGSNKIKDIKTFEKSSYYYNYFIGKNNWKNYVYSYNQAVLSDLYDGIDLKIVNHLQELKYEFILKAGVTSPSQIKMKYAGHKHLKINKKGELIITHSLGQIIEKKPYSYQIINGKIIEVPTEFVINENDVSFKVNKYNPKYDLVIDPTLVFATFAGSVTDNFGMTATYAHDGSAIAGGTVYGNAYPTPDQNAFNINSNFTVPNVSNSVATDVFVSKFSANGTQMLWTSFLGGGDNISGTETVHSMICDVNDNIYLYGITSSLDFPTVNPYQSNHAGGSTINISTNGANFGNNGTDIFVSKFSANGHQLLASTYIGGSGNDGINYHVTAGNYPVNAYDSLTTNYGDQFRGEIILDNMGNCIIASCSRSTNFPLVNPIQNINRGQQDGVTFVLNNNLNNLIFSTYLGGNNNDACYGVKVNSNNQLIVTGGTASNNLNTTPNVWQNTYNGGSSDGFIAIIANNYSSLQHMTYVGTGNYDQTFFIELDNSDNIFVLGQSRGGTFPVINAGYSNPTSGQFIAKFNPTLSTILVSTVFGNGNPIPIISPSAFLVDNCENIYISGWGANLLQNIPMFNMPVTNDAFQSNSPNGFDFYLIVLSRNMGSLIYGSYMGGNLSREHVDGGTSRFDKNGIVYQAVCGGCHGNSDFPTSPNAWSNQNLAVNGCNTVVFKYDFQLVIEASFSSSSVSGCAPYNVTFQNTSNQGNNFIWDFGNGQLDSTTTNPSITYNVPGNYIVNLYISDTICQITDTAQIQITIHDSLEIDLGLDTLYYCSPTTLTLTANHNGTAHNFAFSKTDDFSNPLNSNVSDSTYTFLPTESGWYYCQASNNWCEKTDSIYILILSESISITGNALLCENETTVLSIQNSTPFSFTYTWSPNNIIQSGQGTNQITILPTQNGIVTVEAVSTNGCVIRDTIYISIKDLNIGNIIASSNPTSIMNGDQSTLTALPNIFDSYTWTPNQNIQSTNANQAIVTPNQTTIYTVQGNYQGCLRTDTTIVTVNHYVCENPFVYIPNAFSPNGDGENDVLYVRGVVIKEFIFRIYSRWGELIFETTDQQIGWDGTFKGKKLSPDVYDYYLEVICLDLQKSLIKGNITLLK